MGEQASDQATEAKEPEDQARDRADDQEGGGSENTPTEKPEPDDEDKEKAAEMREAYKERPTLVLPGTGGAVSGTAVGEWLDDDGNPKYGNDEDSPAAKSEAEGDNEDTDERGETDERDIEEQIKKDKEFNAAVIKAAKDEEDKAKNEEDEAESSQDDNEDDKAVSK
jgi:hypothetical protein